MLPSAHMSGATSAEAWELAPVESADSLTVLLDPAGPLLVQIRGMVRGSLRLVQFRDEGASWLAICTRV